MSYTKEIDALATDLAFWYMGLSDPDFPLKGLGRLSQEMAAKFRAMAIMFLMGHGSSDAFLHHLARAGRARLTYLRRLRDAGFPPDILQAAGKYRPLLSAIAAADWDTAKEIVELSPAVMLPGEYEDDHCLAQVVGLLVQDLSPEETTFEPIFERWKAYLDGDPDPRRDVLMALVGRDQAAFDSAFDALLDRFAADVDAAKARRQLEEPVTLALREVDVDALAVLRLAEKRGLDVANEYPYCPSLARDPMTVPFPAI